MYQALYRKWRPRTFDDVVGQSHITDTLKTQVESNRLSHAYLLTGTRGTGKTTCAKILARAANCEQPAQGNPCNSCPACVGIENGSILDVLELDAASNNGVDQVRALRDEAVYSPAAVRKRVYIVDEVHMLSTAAFNALLKILEEPPAHLMFVLATTELHKVPATIKSRCQQFSFQRILPMDIAKRVDYVAREEGMQVLHDGAELIARLADGGLRDAMSLLDQCAVGGGTIDEHRVLEVLGLAGNEEITKLLSNIVARDADSGLANLARLYSGGKDVGAILGELSTLMRDLLIRKTAPKSGSALLHGGYDEVTMRDLSQQLTNAQLTWMLTLVQGVLADLPRSSNRRTDSELCIIRLCEPQLEDNSLALMARIASLEAQLSAGVPMIPVVQAATPISAQPLVVQPQVAPVPVVQAPAPQEPVTAPMVVSIEPDVEEAPPWDDILADEGQSASADENRADTPDVEEKAPWEQNVVAPVQTPVQSSESPVPAQVPDAVPVPPQPVTSQVQPPVVQAPSSASDVISASSGQAWMALVAGLKGRVGPSVWPFLSNPAIVKGSIEGNLLVIWVKDDFLKDVLDKATLLTTVSQVATARMGINMQARVQVGWPVSEAVVTAPVAQATPAPVAQPVATPVPEPEPMPQMMEEPGAPAEDESETAPVSGGDERDSLDELLEFGSQFEGIFVEE